MARRMLRNLSNRPAGQELGFGKNITTEGRMMNPDGSFNVVRQRVALWDNVYYHLMTMSWGGFLGLVFALFMLVNLFYAGIYALVGVQYLHGIESGAPMYGFDQAFFFSSQTLTTVGYGHISPHGLLTNTIAAIESFSGLLMFAMVSGLLYGRFSRPRARVVFSENMLVAPYKGGQGLMFRMGNARRSELIETEVQIFMAMNQLDDNGDTYRGYFPLKLELNKVSFFTLSWTLVHALNEESPLWGFSETDLQDANAELMILVKGMDEANHQSVHARRSYTAEEIVWNAKFKPAIGRTVRGVPLVMNRQIGDYEMVQ